jgi:NADH-quinone oxidoreductase subunit D
MATKTTDKPTRIETSLQESTDEMRDKYMFINMGPSHPAMHGTIRIKLNLDGETVVNSDVEVGYLHRGFEKMCETHTWNQCLLYTDRLNYVSPLINNVGFVLAVEKLYGLDVPERCKYVRVIMSEVSRIADHLTCIAAVVMELGALTAFLYLMKGRELLYDLIEDACGARVTTTYMRVGGMTEDLPQGFCERLLAALPKIDEYVADVNGLITRNRIFMDRTCDTGVISQKDAISAGFTGPCLRSTGVPFDVRKANPYLVYDKMDFEVPVGTKGDNYDRFLVRMEEMKQSAKILRQAVEELPDGPVNADDRSIVLPPKEEVYTSIEGLMNHFKLVMTDHGLEPPVGEVYFPVEGGNGELGFHIVSDGTGKPYRVRARPPSFCLMSGVSKMIDGGMLPDIVPTFGSINMIGGECDR